MPRPEATASAELPRHIPALDGLRGLAILLVMAHHFLMVVRIAPGGPQWVRRVYDAGWCGVDLFFVLSGFLITGILFDAKGQARYFRNFYARRSLRVFPLYYGLLLVGCVLLPLACGLPLHGGKQAWLWSYGTNLYDLLCGHRFDFRHELGLRFSHFWSLAVEEHFYLVWPVAMFCLGRRSLMHLSLALVGLSVLLRTAAVRVGAPWELVYHFTLTRMDGLALGAWAALAVRGPGGVGAMVRPAMLALVASGAAAAAVVVKAGGLVRPHPWTQTFGYTALAVLFAAVMVLAVARPQSPLVRRGLGAGWLRSLGKYSYGLYVFHFLLLSLFARILPPPAGTLSASPAYLGRLTLYVAFCFAGSMAAAWVSYHVVEKHFLRLKVLFAATPAERAARPAAPAGVSLAAA